MSRPPLMFALLFSLSADASPSAPLLTADQLAARLGNAPRCEEHARALHGQEPDKAWALLGACVRRRDFTDLGILLVEPWRDELSRRRDAALVLGRVMAARGGDVEHDLTIVQREGVPLFSLRAALDDPRAYQGRMVAFRGVAREATTMGKQRALVVDETKLFLSAGNVGLAQKKGGRAEPLVDAEQVEREETGRELYARVNGPSPLLETGAEYVFLVRFEGERTGDESGNHQPRGVASIVGWYAPRAGFFEYSAAR